jgi:hypothetical protein
MEIVCVCETTQKTVRALYARKVSLNAPNWGSILFDGQSGVQLPLNFLKRKMHLTTVPNGYKQKERPFSSVIGDLRKL